MVLRRKQINIFYLLLLTILSDIVECDWPIYLLLIFFHMLCAGRYT